MQSERVSISHDESVSDKCARPRTLSRRLIFVPSRSAFANDTSCFRRVFFMIIVSTMAITASFESAAAASGYHSRLSSGSPLSPSRKLILLDLKFALCRCATVLDPCFYGNYRMEGKRFRVARRAIGKPPSLGTTPLNETGSNSYRRDDHFSVGPDAQVL